MMKDTIIIRTDASSEIGIGHVMRTLALAQNLREYFNIHYISTKLTVELKKVLKAEKINLQIIYSKEGTKEDLYQTVEISNNLNARWIIVDGYHFNEQYIDFLKKSGFKILLFDDFAKMNFYSADIILNKGVYARKEMYSNRDKESKLLLGPKYNILRKEFLKYNRKDILFKDIPENMLITMGGADPSNVTLRILEILEEIKHKFKVKVLLGPANKHKKVMKERMSLSQLNIKLIENTNEISSIMNWADFAITSGGTTLFEMAYMGLPSIVIQTVDNQRSAEILSKKYNICNYLCNYKELSTEILETAILGMLDKSVRIEMSNNGRELIDSSNIERILHHIITG